MDATNTADANIADTKLLAQVNLFVAAYGGPATGTQVEKLQFVADRLKSHLWEVAKGQKRREREAVMETQLTQDSADLEG